MNHDARIYLAAAAVVSLGWLLTPPATHAARGRNFNVNLDGDAYSCAELKVRASGEVAQLNQAFTLSKGEAPILELNSADRAQVRVRAWDHADYSIETCKVATADTRAMADAIVRGISVNHSAGNLSFNGPTTDDGEWTVVFLIHAPKDATLNLESKNGPIEVRGVNGNVKLRATNGPIAVSDCGGMVDVQTKNGPIAFTGERGEVRLHAENGPIAVNLPAETWNGSPLEARTLNGPLALSLPENFRSGLRLETDGHSPISCQSALCRNAWKDNGAGKVTLQMNGSGETIHLSTSNGPVAVNSSDKLKRKF